MRRTAQELRSSRSKTVRVHRSDAYRVAQVLQTHQTVRTLALFEKQTKKR